MPLPLSNGRAAGENEAANALLEGYALRQIEGLKQRGGFSQQDLRSGFNSVKDGLLAAVPEHGGDAAPMFNQLLGQSIGGEDQTGSVSVSPAGVVLNRSPGVGRPGWSASINPLAGSVSYQQGDLGIGANLLQRSGRISKGGVTLEGGYGVAPGGIGPVVGAPAGVTAQPGAWGKLSVQAGGGPRKTAIGALGRELDRAVAPWAPDEAPVVAGEPTARELADEQSRAIRAQRGGVNPLYW